MGRSDSACSKSQTAFCKAAYVRGTYNICTFGDTGNAGHNKLNTEGVTVCSTMD